LPDTLLTREGPLLELVFDRPQKLNALTVEMLDAVDSAVERLENDDDVRVLLIRATGRFFSAGIDITALSGGDSGETPAQFRRRYRRTARHDVWDALEAAEKPVVVAHQGPCLGAGLEMSLSCDFRLASTEASYGLPELAMGMIAGSGGTSRLVRTVGPHWARWIGMASQRVPADEALRMGLVHKVWPADELEVRARQFCLGLAGQPADAMAAAKYAIELATDLDRASGRQLERLVNSSLAGRTEQVQSLAALKQRLSAGAKNKK
jgi:enoyl-CoA hydratase